MFLGREDVVRQGEGSDRSLTLPDMAPHQSAPLSEAVMEKIPMSRTPHMEQYDGVSHPQNQSLLPYLISSRSREDTIMRNRAALRSSTPTNDGRPHAPSWLSSTPGASTSSGGSHAMYKAPLWRSSSLSVMPSSQKFSLRPSSQHDPYGFVRMAPDEMGNPRYFRWYQRERQVPSIRSMQHPYLARRYVHRPMEYAHRAQMMPTPQTPPRPSQTPIQAPGEVASVLEPYLSPSTPSTDVESPSLDHVSRLVPSALHHVFEPDSTRDQPHLDKLRVRKQRLHMAYTTGDWSLSDDVAMLWTDSKKRKASNQGPLSTEEKKANHIASEQKRRSNIRKGYDTLASMLPAVTKTEPESVPEEDARANLPNEVSILLEAVEYLQGRLQRHEQLRQRKKDLQHQLFQRYAGMSS